MWAIVYVFDGQVWKWHLLPLPTPLLIPTRYQGRLRDVVQDPGKGYGTGEHLLNLPQVLRLSQGYADKENLYFRQRRCCKYDFMRFMCKYKYTEIMCKYGDDSHKPRGLKYSRQLHGLKYRGSDQKLWELIVGRGRGPDHTGPFIIYEGVWSLPCERQGEIEQFQLKKCHYLFTF